jgi:hypothetical protein
MNLDSIRKAQRRGPRPLQPAKPPIQGGGLGSRNDDLDPGGTLTPSQRDRASQMPKQYLGAYRAAITGKHRISAIKVFCLECQGWERAGVAECPSKACALWSYRPYQTEGDAP